MRGTRRSSILGVGLAFLLAACGGGCENTDSPKNPQLGPICAVSPDTLDFGGVSIGEKKTRSFFVSNVGTGSLQGEVAAGCAGYSVVPGDEYFNLGPAESKEMRVDFQPPTEGEILCILEISPSECSVVCRGAGTLPDSLAPSGVTDLAASGATETSLTLTWTSVGDDRFSGTASSYDLRYATDAGTLWEEMTQASGEPLPKQAGRTESFNLDHLASGQTYFLHLKVGDEVPHWSVESNEATGTTLHPPDHVAPDAVDDLAITAATPTSLTLHWTAVGDDGANGTAAEYDVRYSTSSGATWATMTPAGGEPLPKESGQQEAFVVAGLQSARTYYIRLKTADEAGNWSLQSNRVSGATQHLPDTEPPRTINDLAVVAANAGSLTLRWTAPGDDAASGKAALYDLRFSADSVATWDEMSEASGEPLPKASGQAESFALSGLSPGTTYFVRMRAGDEVPNWSAVSNRAEGTTSPVADVTPPGPVGDLAAGAATSSSLLLTWTAVGDDGANGTAQEYDLRHATRAGAGWNSMTPVSGEPSPRAAGASESFNVTGLLPGTKYYFRLDVMDEAQNRSGGSNEASGTTQSSSDAVPPDAVVDLAVTAVGPTSLTLAWTAVGDDGASGTASEYDLRYGTVAGAAWASMTQASGEPTPGPSGHTETFTLPDLDPGETYFVRVRVADEARNWSADSNEISGTTSAGADVTPPSPVSDLTVVTTGTGSLTLSWTAVGDDGANGTASQYDLRYSTDFGAVWTDMIPASGEPIPAPGGTSESFAVTDLVSGTTYYFRLKVGDEVPNWSAESNQPSGTTSYLPDNTPPSAVSDLEVSGITMDAITLTWTASGDDGEGGTALLYDVRFSTDSNLSWDLMTQAEGEGDPSPAGETDTFTVSGLTAGETYYFRIKVGDEVPNWSGESNQAFGTTQSAPDLTPPDAVDNLTVSSPTGSTLTLSWTAVGDDGDIGAAAHYDLRYSTNAGAAWTAMAQVAQEPDPLPAGQAESFTMTGLSPAKTYYFRLRTGDEVPNWSAESNEASGTTLPSVDTTPPAAVEDLVVSRVTPTTIVLEWSSVGDDGSLGTAAQYDVRYSTNAGAAWTQMIQVADEPTPRPPNQVESFPVAGLSPGTTYFFRMKVGDEVPNWSEESNQASGTTEVVPDIAPPNAVVDLVVTGSSASAVNLAWSAVGDDGSIGTAAQYDVRYSTSAVALWTDMTQASGEPVPGPPGHAESFSVTGLASGTTYFFRLKVGDEVPNWSGESNQAPGATLDVTPPAAVANLATSNPTLTSLRLTWTAVGDDGSSGTAAQYDLRYSTNSGALWESMTQAAGEPSPHPAGQAESFTVSGLVHTTTYYFRLKVGDEVPNWSGVSNQASGSTLDGTPPAAVNDLAVTGAGPTTLDLRWTAVGDDGYVGTAAQYDIRYSTNAGTAWASMTQATGEPLPNSAGQFDVFTLTGLSSQQTYYIRMKVGDEVPNWSGESNEAPGTTEPPPDTIPPAAVLDLNVTAVTISSIALHWTAPGDDGQTGTAAQYDVRYSTNAGTPWASMAQATGEPQPHPGGQSEVFTLSGLAADRTYYIRLKAADEIPNWSGESNEANGSTADETSPAAVDDLAVTDAGPGSLDLQWTAVGDNGQDGTAAQYDVRYSTNAGTAWASMTQATGEPLPHVAGQIETFTLTGLASQRTYYIRMQVADEVPNWSGDSNEASGTTPDVVAPAAVTDLTVTGAAAGSLALAWTAVGDDGQIGTAAQVDLRYSTDPEATWASMTQASGEPLPHAAGAAEAFTLSGLQSDRTYYIRMKVADEVPNWSGESNEASGTTPDVTPPATVAGLAVTNVGPFSVTLSWTAVGDDGMVGTAAQYDLRYSTDAGATWDTMTPATGEPAPQPAGQPETFELVGLTPSTPYFIRLKVADEVPNWSGESNQADATTLPPPDNVPPAAVTDLFIEVTQRTAFVLHWTAVGDDGNEGTAAQYDVRYSTDAGAVWESMTQATGEPQPSVAGEQETFHLEGLDTITTYYIRLRVADEVPNWSGDSNEVSGTTGSMAPFQAPRGEGSELTPPDRSGPGAGTRVVGRR